MSCILVIEDEEDVSSFLRYVLENENFHVETAATLAEARELLSAGLPDAVLLDRGLPDGDGLVLCRELKGTDERRPAVIVLSARKNPEEVREGLEAGADDYLVKPFNFVSVLDRVRALTA